MSQNSTKGLLHRLIYCSDICLPAAELEDALDDIIRASIRNNRAAGLTGLLLIHAGRFVQALEGPMQAVLTTYGRISADPRHTRSKVLAAGPARDREFGAWNMCARRMSPIDAAILDTLEQREAFDPVKLSGNTALRLLKAVRGIQDRQLRAGAL